MMENKMAWQEGYEAGYAAAMEHFNEACEQEYKDGYECGLSERYKEITKLTAERDAAVADLKEGTSFPCHYCKKEYTPSCNCWTAYDKWQWRGLSLETETSDKEEKHD